MSLDLAGPFKAGTDQSGKGRRALMKEVSEKRGPGAGEVAGDGKDRALPEVGLLEGGELAEMLETEGEERGMEPEGEIADDGDEWLKRIEEEKEFEMRQLTLVEIVPTRHQKEVTAALARMVLWNTCSAAAQ